LPFAPESSHDRSWSNPPLNDIVLP
jgi:hypothetical protein